MKMYLKALFEDLAGYPDYCTKHGSHSTGKSLHLHRGYSAAANIMCRGADSGKAMIIVQTQFILACLEQGHFQHLPQPFNSEVQQPSCCGVLLED